jgi:hypothetical protein
MNFVNEGPQKIIVMRKGIVCGLIDSLLPFDGTNPIHIVTSDDCIVALCPKKKTKDKYADIKVGNTYENGKFYNRGVLVEDIDLNDNLIILDAIRTEEYDSEKGINIIQEEYKTSPNKVQG